MRKQFNELFNQFEEMNQITKLDLINRMDEEQCFKAKLLDEVTYVKKKKRINTKNNYET